MSRKPVQYSEYPFYIKHDLDPAKKRIRILTPVGNKYKNNFGAELCSEREKMMFSIGEMFIEYRIELSSNFVPTGY